MSSASSTAADERGRARADREVAVAQLRGDGAAGEAGAAQPLGDELGEPPDLRVQHARARTTSCANVSSAETETCSGSSSRSRGSIPRARSRRSGADRARQHRLELGVGERGEPADRVDPRSREPLLRARPDAGKQADRQRREEARLASGRDDRDPAGLPPVGRDLADDLRGRDAERAGQARRRAHRGLDRGRRPPRAREKSRATVPRSR